jgi:hypothetical protein
LEERAHVSIEPGPLLLSTVVSSDDLELKPLKKNNEYLLIELATNSNRT